MAFQLQISPLEVNSIVNNDRETASVQDDSTAAANEKGKNSWKPT